MANANSETSKKTQWIEGLKAEFRKIIWPTREDITKETTAVVVCSVLLGARRRFSGQSSFLKTLQT